MENNVYTVPSIQLKTTRNWIVTLLLSFITCGIYLIFEFSTIGEDLNTVASRYDGKKTMHFCLLAFVLAPLTCGIWSIVWFHQLSARIGAELQRRGIDYSFGASDFWIFNILCSFFVFGPFVYLHKLYKAINLLNEDYNAKG